MLLEINKTFLHIWKLVSPMGLRVIECLAILIIGQKVIQLIKKLLEKAASKSKIDKGVTSFLISFFNFLLYVTLILLAANVVGIPTATFIAILGSTGLAIGLSLQGTLQNFAGGVLILLMKPFVAGNYIMVNGLEGTVSRIDVCYTTLKTIDNKVVVLPNGALANTNIVNVSREKYRRVDLIIPISYSDDIKLAKDVLTKVAANEELAIKTKPVEVYVSDFGADSIQMGFRVWVKTVDYWPAKWALLEAVKYEMDKNGLTIPFNQIDVHFDK